MALDKRNKAIVVVRNFEMKYKTVKEVKKRMQDYFEENGFYCALLKGKTKIEMLKQSTNNEEKHKKQQTSIDKMITRAAGLSNSTEE